MGGVVNTPPLKKWEISGEEAWQIAARGTKRYEVAAAQGGEVLKAKHRAEAEREKERRNKRRGAERREWKQGSIGEEGEAEESIGRRAGGRSMRGQRGGRSTG